MSHRWWAIACQWLWTCDFSGGEEAFNVWCDWRRRMLRELNEALRSASEGDIYVLEGIDPPNLRQPELLMKDYYPSDPDMKRFFEEMRKIELDAREGRSSS